MTRQDITRAIEAAGVVAVIRLSDPAKLRDVIHALAAFTFAEFFVALLLAAALSMWIYWHASRHGSRHATAWGIAAFFFSRVAG